MTDALSRITKVIRECGLAPGHEAITPDTNLINDLGCDSLEIVDLMLTLESEFGVKIPDEDAQRFETVGDVVKWIEGAMA